MKLSANITPKFVQTFGLKYSKDECDSFSYQNRKKGIFIMSKVGVHLILGYVQKPYFSSSKVGVCLILGCVLYLGDYGKWASKFEKDAVSFAKNTHAPFEIYRHVTKARSAFRTGSQTACWPQCHVKVEQDKRKNLRTVPGCFNGVVSRELRTFVSPKLL